MLALFSTFEYLHWKRFSVQPLGFFVLYWFRWNWTQLFNKCTELWKLCLVWVKLIACTSVDKRKRKTEWQTDTQTDQHSQTDRQTDRPNVRHRQTDRQTSKRIYRKTDSLCHHKGEMWINYQIVISCEPTYQGLYIVFSFFQVWF